MARGSGCVDKARWEWVCRHGKGEYVCIHDKVGVGV